MRSPFTRTRVPPADLSLSASLFAGPEFKGDEYEQLIQYVDFEAERSKRGGDERQGDEEEEEKRVWYAPWKTKKVKSDKAKKVRFQCPIQMSDRALRLAV